MAVTIFNPLKGRTEQYHMMVAEEKENYYLNFAGYLVIWNKMSNFATILYKGQS